MAEVYGEVMFGEASRRLQERYGSRAQYERIAERGLIHDGLTEFEIEFLATLDTFFLGTVTEDGWPYIQHRGGPKGFLRALDARTLAFADYAGNKQYISAGNLETNDKVSLFLVDFPAQARLKVIGHGRVVEAGQDAALESRVAVPGHRAKVERIFVMDVVAYDWNCSQHITPRWTRDEVEAALGPKSQQR